MAYPAAPGVNSHPSLPPRPPPAPASAKPSGFSSTFSSSTSSYPSSTSYSSAPSYGTAAPPANTQYGAPQQQSSSSYSSSSYSQPPLGTGRGSSYGAPQQPQAPPAYGYPQSYSSQPPSLGPQFASATAAAAPQIRNPFPAPDERGTDFDPDMAAQIAQWQSAYVSKEPGSEVLGGKAGRPGAPGENAYAAPAVAEVEGQAQQQNKKTVYRQGGGKKWADDSLVEWDPSHLRLFVGNLAGEVTDESLGKAFGRWRSFQRAKVIRDKRTTKSKGFGFVSFSDPDDFFQAAKEMNGKYIQSHPVIVKKSTTDIKVTKSKDDKKGGKNQKKGPKSGNGGGGGGKQDGGYEPHLGPVGGGVVKSGQKTKGGLKLLG